MRLQAELAQIQKEPNPEFRVAELRVLVRRLVEHGDDASAREVIAMLPPDQAPKLDRFESEIGRFASDLMNPRFLVPLVAGSTAFNLARTWSAARLAAVPASLLSRGPVARGLSLLAASAVEAPFVFLAQNAKGNLRNEPFFSLGLGASWMQFRIASGLGARVFGPGLEAFAAAQVARNSRSAIPLIETEYAFASQSSALTKLIPSEAKRVVTAPLQMSALNPSGIGDTVIGRLEKLGSAHTVAASQAARQGEAELLTTFHGAETLQRFEILEKLRGFYRKNSKLLPGGWIDVVGELEKDVFRAARVEHIWQHFLQGAPEVPYLNLPTGLKPPSILTLTGDAAQLPMIAVNPYSFGHILSPHFFRLRSLGLYQAVVSDKKISRRLQGIAEHQDFAQVSIARNHEGEPFLHNGYHRSFAADRSGATHILGFMGRDRVKPTGPRLQFEDIRVIPHEELEKIIEANKPNDHLLKGLFQWDEID